MGEKLKCPYCGSENVIRMDGAGVVKKYGPNVMIDIAPKFVYCNDCKKEFKDDIFENIQIDDDLEEK